MSAYCCAPLALPPDGGKGGRLHAIKGAGRAILYQVATLEMARGALVQIFRLSVGDA